MDADGRAGLSGALRFRDHAIVFVVVNVVLVGVWLATRAPASPSRGAADGSPWPAWVLGVWGLVLAGHALVALRAGRTVS